MAPPTGTVVSYENTTNREDLVDQIFMVSPYETPWLARMDRNAAYANSHDWPVDSLASPAADNAAIEGDDAGTAASINPLRPSNYCQLFEKVASVSTTQQAVAKPGRQDDLNYHIWKKSLEILTDCETDMFGNQTKVAASSGVAPRLAGIQTWLYTNTFHNGAGAPPDYSGTGFADGTAARTPGTNSALTEANFDEVVEKIYNSGGNPNSVYTDIVIKNGIGKVFEGIATKYQQLTVEQRNMQGGIDIYDSVAGRLEIIPTRHTGGNEVYILQDDLWAMSDLIPLNSQPLAKTGHSDREMLEMQTTLEARNEVGSGAIYDVTKPV